MSTRGRRIKPIGEILRFMDDLPITEFHDAHRIGWNAIVSEYKFGDPEISAACHSPDRKSLFIWLNEPALLNVVPTANPLARLRIIKHRIFAIDFMFDLEVVRIRSVPMALQQFPHGPIIHLGLH